MKKQARTTKGTVGILAVVAVLMGSAALADAAWRPRLRRRRVVRPVRVVRHRRIVRVAPRKPVVVAPRVIKPLVVPSVTVAPTTVTLPAEPAAAVELKAEIAKLKHKYNKLSTTRQNLRNWLRGTGKYHSTGERTKVQVRLAKVNRECTLVAAEIAELEQTLAEL